MDSALEIQGRASKQDLMLCPCCGSPLVVTARQCACGARFVGEPLDEKPIKVQRLGPIMTALLLLVLVVSAALIFTKWFALGAAVVIWSSARAVRLARRDPEWYGGYRVATTTLAITILASMIAASVAIANIPRYFKNRGIAQVAATQSAMRHVASLLEDYKSTCGSYPRNAQEIAKAMNESLPADYWEQKIKYQSYTVGIAEKDASPIGMAGLASANFELRSAGPDGIPDTDDDIIMRDGVFLTAAEARRQAVPRASTGR